MIIDAKGNYGKGLSLGTQTNIGNVEKNAVWLARKWAPKKAKSCTICFEHTDYYGNKVEIETGYSEFYVLYYSTEKEGLVFCPDSEKSCIKYKKLEKKNEPNTRS